MSDRTGKAMTKRVRGRVHLFYVALAAIFLVADQWTKATVTSYFGSLPIMKSIPALGGLFRITYARNTGGAFGIFAGDSMSLLLPIVSVLALGFIAWYYWAYRGSGWMRLALALITGGAIGNFVDRVRLGYVTDFIDVDIGSYQWPYFNLADTFISVGATILVLYLLFSREVRVAEERIDDAPSMR